MKRYDSRRDKMSFAFRPIWAATYEKLESVLPPEVMHEWVDCFELIDLSMKKAVIFVNGDANMDRFMEQYYNDFADCFYSVLGYEVNIKFKQKPKKSKGRMVFKRLIILLFSLILLGISAALMVSAISLVENQGFQETFYQVSSGKVTDSLRIVQLSDLHNTVFGENNDELVRRLGLLKPDVIVMTGDMIEQTDDGWEVTLDLSRRLTEVAPVYYIYGNNECTKLFNVTTSLQDLDELLGMGEGSRDISAFRTLDDSLRTALEEAGVHVLLNESARIEANGNTVDIYGSLASNPSSFWPYSEESFGEFLYEDTGNMKIMLCHEPYIYENLKGEYWGDLVLCGHTHGGIIRVPKFGGLYERQDGLFPERKGAYIQGQYSVNGTPLIVSGGLTNRGIIRINNQPELVIVDVNRY